jgi:hypothetical protein
LHRNLGNAATHGAGTYDAEIGKYWLHAPNYDSTQVRLIDRRCRDTMKYDLIPMGCACAAPTFDLKMP